MRRNTFKISKLPMETSSKKCLWQIYSKVKKKKNNGDYKTFLN